MVVVQKNIITNAKPIYLVLLFGIYFGFAPIYWLPDTSVSTLRLVKIVLFVLCVFALNLNNMISKKALFPKGMVGPLGLISLLSAGIFAYYLAPTLSIVISKVLDYLLGFIVLWSFYTLQKYKGLSFNIYMISVVIIAVFSGFTVSNYLFNFPNPSAPVEFMKNPLSVAAFGASRTGWSSGVSSYAVLAYGLSFTCTRKKLKYIFLIAFVIILFSQIIVSGRAGILAAIIVPLIYTIMTKNWRHLIIFAIVFIVVFACYGDIVKETFRLERLQNVELNIKVFDKFSAGRLAGYDYALKLASQEPLFGYGFGQDVLLVEGEHEIHNLWLKMLVEGGVILPFSFLLYVIYLIHRIEGSRKMVTVAGANTYVNALYCVFISGLIVSIFEPNILIGSFQVSALWWASIGSMVGLLEKSTKIQKKYQMFGLLNINR